MIGLAAVPGGEELAPADESPPLPDIKSATNRNSETSRGFFLLIMYKPPFPHV